MPSNHLILCRPLLLLPSVFPNIRVFSNESVLRIRMKIMEKIKKELWIGRMRNRRRRIEKIKKEFSSVQSLRCVQLFATPWIAARQASLSITNSRSSLRHSPSSQWCHPAISSSVVPFSSCPQSFPASESFPMSQLFSWSGQSTGVSSLASFLPKKSQGWSPSEWTGWISLQAKGLSRVFSNTTVQKYQFFGAQPSPQSNSHIHTWPQEKP